ncbi:MAG: O-antigen ligase family protein [Actinomycetes bacterium]
MDDTTLTRSTPLFLIALLICWLLMTSTDGRGDPWPVVGAAAVAAVAFVLGQLVPGPVRPWVAVAIGAVAMGAVLLGDGPLDFVTSGPLGYANANAALAAQATAAFGVAATGGLRSLRLVALAGAAAGLVTCALIGAVAAAAGAVLVLVALGATSMRSDRAQQASIALSLAVVVGASALSFVVGALGASPDVARLVSERRVSLWTDGVTALREDPVVGAGARGFPSVSPTAAGDPDTREAHAELLQRSAENGLIGVGLEGAAVASVFVGLARRRDAVATVGVAGMAALWANAGVDWVLAFPSVLGTGCLVVGLAAPQGAVRRARRRPG